LGSCCASFVTAAATARVLRAIDARDTALVVTAGEEEVGYGAAGDSMDGPVYLDPS